MVIKNYLKGYAYLLGIIIGLTLLLSVFKYFFTVFKTFSLSSETQITKSISQRLPHAHRPGGDYRKAE